MSEHQTNEETEHQSHGAKHMITMMMCCFLPIIAIVVIATIFPASSYLTFAFILICPLSMIMMYLPDLLSKKKKHKASCY